MIVEYEKAMLVSTRYSFVLAQSEFTLFFLQGGVQWVRSPAPERTPFCMASLNGLRPDLPTVRPAVGLATEMADEAGMFAPILLLDPWFRAILLASEKVLAAVFVFGDMREKRDIFIAAVVKPN